VNCKLKADGTLASEGFNLTVLIADVLLACGTQTPFPIVELACMPLRTRFLIAVAFVKGSSQLRRAPLTLALA
jgi:hypothetical protein